ncbi:MAG: tyrosine recombinase XerC [Bacteroidaceae bacterium]|nr:tyrosine recombinase XerC [Bacteroidaceae bacterium]
MKKEQFVDIFPSYAVEFLNYYSVIKNRSDLTVTEYANDLLTFFRFLKVIRGLANKDIPFEEINVDDLSLDLVSSVTLTDAYMFLVYCKDNRGNNERTRARKATTLRNFYKYLSVQKRLINDNPLQELDSPKLKKTLPKYLTLDESLALLEAVDGKFRERDYCIITLFLNCGLRLSELVSLNLSDIRTNNTIVVTGKGNKERTIYLNQACIDAINAYLPFRLIDGVKDKNALFISRQKGRISPKTIQYIIKNTLEKAGLGDRELSTHKLRHTAATLMYQYGDVDVLAIKEILGHESLSTTQIYTHIMDEQLKKAAESNPLSSVKAPRRPVFTAPEQEDDNSSGNK